MSNLASKWNFGEHSIKVLLLLPECEICGQEAHPKFLKVWNGKEACKYCISEIEKETEQHAIYNYS